MSEPLQPCPGPASMWGKPRPPCIQCDRRIQALTEGEAIKAPLVFDAGIGWTCEQRVSTAGNLDLVLGPPRAGGAT